MGGRQADPVRMVAGSPLPDPKLSTPAGHMAVPGGNNGPDATFVTA
jgi:hypothetical protein